MLFRSEAEVFFICPKVFVVVVLFNVCVFFR